MMIPRLCVLFVRAQRGCLGDGRNGDRGEPSGVVTILEEVPRFSTPAQADKSGARESSELWVPHGRVVMDYIDVDSVPSPRPRPKDDVIVVPSS